MAADTAQWASQIRAGDARAISRALSAIEDRARAAEDLLRLLFPSTGRARRIGLTGAPGAGKSTLAARLAAHYRRENKSVGVIAVDPSSPFTGGAILGDRIRMQSHAADSGIFIRSMATRGMLGGLAEATGDAALLLDAAGNDVILIETAGVGQGEVEIARMADCVLVLLVPGMGDDVQSLKAGLMEIGDIFVLNKSDREGAAAFEQQLRAILQMAPERSGWRPPVMRAVATEDQGTDELGLEIARFIEHSAEAPDRPAREIAYWKQWLLRLAESRVRERVAGNRAGEAQFDSLAAEVAARRKDPYAAVKEILTQLGLEDARI
jgi:LAO/AO transport system kinase